MIANDFLQSHALFAGITDEDLTVIDPMLKEEHFEVGEFIITEGDSGNRLYFLNSGRVEVLKDTPSPDGPVRERIAELGPGDTFGEMEIIDIQPRAASARVLTDAETLSMSSHDLYHLYKTCPHAHTIIVLNLAREISRRLRTMDALVASSLYRSHSQA